MFTKKLLITITFALAISVFFSWRTFGEVIPFSELPLKLQAGILRLLGQTPAQPEEGTQIYELLIKKTQTGTGEGAYQAGDIVSARPKGHNWSAGEINNFWIVRMILTPSQAEALVQAKEIVTGVDENGEEIKELLARRKYYIEPELLEGADGRKGMNVETVKER